MTNGPIKKLKKSPHLKGPSPNRKPRRSKNIEDRRGRDLSTPEGQFAEQGDQIEALAYKTRRIGEKLIAQSNDKSIPLTNEQRLAYAKRGTAMWLGGTRAVNILKNSNKK